MTYLYEGEKPDAASQIGEDRYTYDDNGNPTLIVSDSTTRTITWDEENRMVMLNDDGYVSRYTYDFSGTRVIKSHGPQESVYINGAEQGLDYHDADNYTLYVSPYLIVNNERFTKHYYAGTQRIASKVGSGDFYNVYGVNGFHLTAGDKDYKERLEQIEEGVKEYYNANGIPPGEPTQKGSNADPTVTDVALPNVELGNYDVPSDWPTNVKFNEPGDVPGPVVQFEDEDLGDVKAGYGFESDNLYEGDWFFFHTDHLGSTSYLTDTAGNVSQFVCYTPYGEAIVDEHLTTYENPFKFSGKELDDITGLYDHGARSRNPVSTLWYGVDPLFEKYPDFSPYNYCAGNPVKLVDEDGRDWYSYESESTNDKGEKVVTTKYAYTNAKSQADLNKTGVKGTYMGNIVVTFDGSMHEKLGKGDFINGEGAITAKVTVYGPNGPKDIQHYTGFTMSSDYKTFGAIADGTYDVSYDEIGKSGSLKSHYAVNARNAVPCIDGKNPNPYKGPDGSDVYKYGIFVHGTNRNGWAGYKTTYVTDSHGNKKLKPTIVSSGCLLIQGDQYGRFCNQIGNNGFKLVLKRTK